MDGTADLLGRYLEASLRKDLEAMASCWHDDGEGIYPLRPDREWRGMDGFRRVWSRMWDQNPGSRYEVLATGAGAAHFFIEARIELPDGNLVPSVNVFEVTDGKIKTVRVYADLPTRDGVAIDDFISNRAPGHGPHDRE
jgi:hypothetical protein